MNRRTTAMVIVCASLAYLALSLVDKATASNAVLVYIAAVVTLLFLAETVHKQGGRRGPQR